MIAGQGDHRLPVLAAFALAAIQAADTRVRRNSAVPRRHTHARGVDDPFRVRFALVAALLNGFGRVISEVGLRHDGGRQYRGRNTQHPDRHCIGNQQGRFCIKALRWAQC